MKCVLSWLWVYKYLSMFTKVEYLLQEKVGKVE